MYRKECIKRIIKLFRFTDGKCHSSKTDWTRFSLSRLTFVIIPWVKLINGVTAAFEWAKPRTYWDNHVFRRMKAALMRVNYDPRYTHQPGGPNNNHKPYEPLSNRITLAKEIYKRIGSEKKPLKESLEEAARKKVKQHEQNKGLPEVLPPSRNRTPAIIEKLDRPKRKVNSYIYVHQCFCKFHLSDHRYMVTNFYIFDQIKSHYGMLFIAN